MTDADNNHESVNLGRVLGDRAHSGDPAVIGIDTAGRTSHYSCAEIEAGSNGVAALVQSKGLEPGESIGIMAGNSVEYLLAYLGIMRAGYVCVPINIKQPIDTINFICSDAGVKLVFVDDFGRKKLAGLLPSIHLGDLPAHTGTFTSRPTDPRSTALILYTSGSTGRPKGVVLSHASQLSMVDKVKEGESAALFRDQRGIVVAPMFHMNALVFIAAYLGGGGSIVLMSKFNAEQFAGAIEKHEVNVITGVPTMIALLHSAWTSMKQPDFSSVHTVYIGSAPVTAAIVEQALEMMPNSMVLNSYGTTETGGGLFGPHPEGIQRPPTSVGYPLPGIGIRLDGNTDNEGVLVVKAPSAMTEYLNLPELTAERIRDGWINTGDIFSVDSNGFFYFVGRNDDMFVCSGENIFPGEVERVLESHPSVDQASVVPVPDKIRGQMPVAWVVSRDGNVDETALQDYVRARAAPYIYPRKVWFLDELPLAGTSKIDRNLLTARALDKLSARDDVA